jgi:hypothetical protein
LWYHFQRAIQADSGDNSRNVTLRLEFKLKSLPPEILTEKFEETWSIKENAGHLSDPEPLWQERLEDILIGKEELREGLVNWEG